VARTAASAQWLSATNAGTPDTLNPPAGQTHVATRKSQPLPAADVQPQHTYSSLPTCTETFIPMKVVCFYFRYTMSAVHASWLARSKMLTLADLTQLSPLQVALAGIMVFIVSVSRQEQRERPRLLQSCAPCVSGESQQRAHHCAPLVAC